MPQPGNVNVLVFPCGAEIGLEIHAALSTSRFVTLYGGSSVDDHGRLVYRNYIGDLPQADSPEFAAAMAGVVQRLGIDLVFPAHDSAIVALAQHAATLGCEVVTSPLETCRICRSKRATYAHLEGAVPAPVMYPAPAADLPYPVFLKPDVSQGSRGTHLARSVEEATFHAARGADMLILEYLPGVEYTVDCFTDRAGRLIFAGPRTRRRISNGISVNTSPVESPELTAMAQRVNALLELRGPWFFQARAASDGELKLLEVAPRVAGSSGVHRARGVNLPLLGVFDAMDVPVRIAGNAIGVELDRALCNRYRTDVQFDEVYVDLDDTLVLRGRVSPPLVAFLYQCLNEGKRVHLLSSHAGDIAACLARYRLSGIFDTVTHLSKDQHKADYISAGRAIFIDDSFAERSRVAERLGIPTFDSSGVECLLDWRA